ncbi:spore germination protein GerW family protein [Anaerolineales bacterium HSG6]|nr:spore germination protein GerW family protein [Anaerolineales bacterium HSG6]MDM8531596.1 spore germination protein GerW family protein [Anaerolineales bacterium HSG25]
MTQETDVFDRISEEQAKNRHMLEKLLSFAESGSVYSEPVTRGDYAVITASEVTVGMAVGYGMGEAEAEDDGDGGGGGGGGGAYGRPVAVVSIGPDGVQVKEVVDPTKIALALFTTIGAMFLMLRQIFKAVGV